MATPKYFLPWALKRASREQSAPLAPEPGAELGVAGALDEATTTALDVELTATGSTTVGVGLMMVDSVDATGAGALPATH